MNGHHLAELNVGRLVAPADDPRVAEFVEALDLVNGLAQKMPGFVWMMQGLGEAGSANPEIVIANDPQYLANMSVWEDVESLEKFVWGTVHKKFYERGAEWFEVLGEQHFVMWWVPEGHEPTLDEALQRLEMRREHGDSEDAFGWDYLEQAKLHKTHQCREDAA